MADQSSFFNTPILRMPYIGKANQRVTPEIERQRFTTLDVQLEALFSVLGNGVITGWNISSNPPLNPDGSQPEPAPLTVYISPGRGHVNSMAAETYTWSTIGNLTDGSSIFPGINYIYAATSENTPVTKETIFFVTNSALTQDNIILLGIVTVIDGEVTIDSSGKVDIGFLSILLSSLAAHRHGKDGISAVDLASEVKGFLDSLHIGDIPAERITSGTIDPARFFLEHASLLNAGSLPHEDLDSIVEVLQKGNRRLFGDITATNLMQLVMATKQTITTVDRFFRNLIIIIPGNDNNTFLGVNSFLDEKSIIPKNLYDLDSDISETVNPLNSEVVVFNNDAAIADFNEGYITGVLSGGISIHERDIDTLAEFTRGNYDDSRVSISVYSSVDNPYVYGYGFGYGEGLDFFDVFGIASEELDMYGYGVHTGYGLTVFESDFSGSYGYGYGYEYIEGGGQLPGHVNVTLIRGVADVTLDTTIDYPADFTENQTAADAANTDNLDIYNQLIERFKYNFPDSGLGSAGIASFENPRLLYNFNTEEDSESDKWDWTEYDTFLIRFKPLSEGAVSSYIFDRNWYFVAVSEVSVDGIATEIESDPIEIIGMQDGDILVLDEASEDFDNVISIDISSIGPVDFDKSKVKRFKLYTDPDEIREISEDTEAIEWDVYISSLSLGGHSLYSSDDTVNKVDKLYFIIPAIPAAHLEYISWLADEPTDSRVLIYIKTVDINTDTSGLDGFTLLESLGDAGFGSPYMNKSRGGDSARPSGSTMTEANGTHIEVKVVLQPSTDGLFAPTLHAINIKYSIVGADEVITFDTDEQFDLVEENVRRINISLNSDSQLEIKNSSEIRSRRYGTSATFQELKNINGIYSPITHVNNTGNNLPRTLYQYLDNSLPAGFSGVSAVKRLSDQRIVLADTANHRIVVLNKSTNEMEWGLYGTSVYNNTDVVAELYPVFAHYNDNNSTLYVGFTHVINSNINISKWYLVDNDSYITLNNSATDGDSVSIINANGIGGAVGGGVVAITFGSKTLAKYESLSGGISLSIDSSTVSSAATSAKRISSFNNIPVEKYNIYYGDISNPIDIKVDADDNLIIAQALNSDSSRDAQAIFKISLNNPNTYIYNYKTASDGVAFGFDSIYCGSVEEILSDSGSIELLVADVNNQRVIRFAQDGGTIIWQLNTDSTGGKASIPQNLYPSCATRGDNGAFYITLVDKSTGKNSKVIEVTNDFVLTKTILDGIVRNPCDVHYIEGKLLIST